MKIRAGYRITFDSPAPTPILFVLSVHPELRDRLITPDAMTVSQPCDLSQYLDGFGNLVTRVVAPVGPVTFSSDFLIEDSGLPDLIAGTAGQVPVEDLPDDVLTFLLGSRYCETDAMSELAWSLFGATEPGWARVQAIVDYAHKQIAFDYQQDRAYRSAHEGHGERVGVCRDYAHLAIALCRCMNIPARYCTGYLSDIGAPPLTAPMDFSAWFEAYLEGGWHTFDARFNAPRIGRILIARGRDATDVAISTTFGTTWMTRFEVITEAYRGDPAMRPAAE